MDEQERILDVRDNKIQIILESLRFPLVILNFEISYIARTNINCRRLSAEGEEAQCNSRAEEI